MGPSISERGAIKPVGPIRETRPFTPTWKTPELDGSGVAVDFAATVDNRYRMLAAKRGNLIIGE